MTLKSHKPEPISLNYMVKTNPPHKRPQNMFIVSFVILWNLYKIF